MEGKKIYRLIFLLVVYAGFYAHMCLAQLNETPKDVFLEAESYFLYEEFNEALPLYQKLKEQFPENYNLDYRIGCCYLNISYELSRSIPFLEAAVRHISVEHKETSLKETNAPVDAWFFLGDAYRVNNRLEKAIESYKKFKKLVTDKDYDFALVDHQISACERAIAMKQKQADIDETNLGDIINTRYSETNPVISSDESMLVYAARLPFYQAMFYSRKVDGKWTLPVNMLPELGVDGDCFPTSISAEGTELYIYRSDEFHGDLYVSNFRNGKWSKIRKLNDNINTKYWESHACISPDGKILYFTSNRPGGLGQLDIYAAKRSAPSDDNWGVPVNLGPVVNSRYHEDTPFLTADGKRMYFSSFGHETIGGFDVFYSDLNRGAWGKPVNMGFPVNTTSDDLFFNPGKDGTCGYLAKFDREGFGRYDIVRREIFNRNNPRRYQVKGTLEGTGKDLYLAVYDEVKKDTVIRKIIHSGAFSFETTSGNYSLIFREKGFPEKVIPLRISEGSKEKIRDIGEVSVPKQIIAEVINFSTAETLKPNLEKEAVNKSDLYLKTDKSELFKPVEDAKPGEQVKINEVAGSSSQNAMGQPLMTVQGKALTQQVRSNSSRLIIVSVVLIVFIVFIFIFVNRRKKDKEHLA